MLLMTLLTQAFLPADPAVQRDVLSRAPADSAQAEALIRAFDVAGVAEVRGCAHGARPRATHACIRVVASP